jgi:aminoglycoside phosphotransferase (APT) family kinase protein
MAAAATEFTAAIEAVVTREIADCTGLTAAARLSGGANQEMYRLTIATAGGERKLCLRRAPGGAAQRDAIKGPGLITEAALLRTAHAHGIPVPQVHYVLQPADGLGDGFIMAWLDGETLGSRILKAPELAAIRPQLAYDCGKILGRIHAIDIEASTLASQLQTITPAQFVQQTWDRYQALRSPQPMIDYTARWLLDHLPKNPRRTLVHNDFRNGNLMVTPTGINAVLDWELTHIGDPMRDLGWLCTHSWRFGCDDKPVGGFGDYADLFRGYEETSGITVNRNDMHFWEVFGSFWWAMGCLEMASAGRSGPEKSIERPAIGRRSSECQIDCVNMLIPGPIELLAPATSAIPDDIARIDDILAEVKDFLRAEVAAITSGRTQFLAKVAANSLDIALRDLQLAPGCQRAEHARLKALLQKDGDLNTLRWALCEGLRDGSITLAREGLATHLRNTVANQIVIDQPGYAGFRTAQFPEPLSACKESQ